MEGIMSEAQATPERNREAQSLANGWYALGLLTSEQSSELERQVAVLLDSRDRKIKESQDLLWACQDETFLRAAEALEADSLGAEGERREVQLHYAYVFRAFAGDPDRQSILQDVEKPDLTSAGLLALVKKIRQPTSANAALLQKLAILVGNYRYALALAIVHITGKRTFASDGERPLRFFQETNPTAVLHQLAEVAWGKRGGFEADPHLGGYDEYFAAAIRDLAALPEFVEAIRAVEEAGAQ
jgi:hypothetical protein